MAVSVRQYSTQMHKSHTQYTCHIHTNTHITQNNITKNKINKNKLAHNATQTVKDTWITDGGEVLRLTCRPNFNLEKIPVGRRWVEPRNIMWLEELGPLGNVMSTLGIEGKRLSLQLHLMAWETLLTHCLHLQVKSMNQASNKLQIPHYSLVNMPNITA
jgi:hypothetical protein